MVMLYEDTPPADAPYTIEAFSTLDEWLEARQLGLGGSDLPILMGLSRWSSPFELWALKTGKLEANGKQGLRLAVGHQLENLVANETLLHYPELQQAELPTSHYMLRAKAISWCQYSPDDILLPHGQALETVDPELVRLAEYKTVDPRARDDWDSEPSKVASVQLQWGLGITGWPSGIIAAIIGLGDEFLAYDQPAHRKLQEVLLERADAFWRCIATDTPPDTDHTEATKRALAALYPKDTGETIPLDPTEYGPVLSAWRIAKGEAAAVKAKLDAAQNRLVAAIGSATRAEIEGYGALTYKSTNRKGYSVEASTFRTLREAKEAK